MLTAAAYAEEGRTKVRPLYSFEGDSDATPDSASIRFLTGKQSLEGKSTHYLDAWQQAGDSSPGYTWTFRNGFAAKVIARRLRQPRHARRIDYIFLGSPHDYDRFARLRACRVALDKPHAGVWPSDHYAVYAEIEVVPAGGRREDWAESIVRIDRPLGPKPKGRQMRIRR